MAIKVGGTTVIDDSRNVCNIATLNATNASVSTVLTIPAGTDGTRPASPSAGTTRWNTSNNYLEVYSGTAWCRNLTGTSNSPSADGNRNITTCSSASGQVTIDLSNGSNIYCIVPSGSFYTNITNDTSTLDHFYLDVYNPFGNWTATCDSKIKDCTSYEVGYNNHFSLPSGRVVYKLQKTGDGCCYEVWPYQHFPDTGSTQSPLTVGSRCCVHCPSSAGGSNGVAPATCNLNSPNIGLHLGLQMTCSSRLRCMANGVNGFYYSCENSYITAPQNAQYGGRCYTLNNAIDVVKRWDNVIMPTKFCACYMTSCVAASKVYNLGNNNSIFWQDYFAVTKNSSVCNFASSLCSAPTSWTICWPCSPTYGSYWSLAAAMPGSGCPGCFNIQRCPGFKSYQYHNFIWPEQPIHSGRGNNPWPNCLCDYYGQVCYAWAVDPSWCRCSFNFTACIPYKRVDTVNGCAISCNMVITNFCICTGATCLYNCYSGQVQSSFFAIFQPHCYGSTNPVVSTFAGCMAFANCLAGASIPCPITGTGSYPIIGCGGNALIAIANIQTTTNCVYVFNDYCYCSSAGACSQMNLYLLGNSTAEMQYYPLSSSALLVRAHYGSTLSSNIFKTCNNLIMPCIFPGPGAWTTQNRASVDSQKCIMNYSLWGYPRISYEGCNLIAGSVNLTCLAAFCNVEVMTCYNIGSTTSAINSFTQTFCNCTCCLYNGIYDCTSTCMQPTSAVTYIGQINQCAFAIGIRCYCPTPCSGVTPGTMAWYHVSKIATYNETTRAWSETYCCKSPGCSNDTCCGFKIGCDLHCWVYNTYQYTMSPIYLELAASPSIAYNRFAFGHSCEGVWLYDCFCTAQQHNGATGVAAMSPFWPVTKVGWYAAAGTCLCAIPETVYGTAMQCMGNPMEITCTAGFAWDATRCAVINNSSFATIKG